MAGSDTYSPKVYKRDGGDTIGMKSGATAAVDAGVGGFCNQIRKRFTIAQVNAGATILAALPGYAYRVHDVALIAIGGAVGAATTIDVLGTQSTSSVKLLAAAIANLTQSALLRAGATGATILADGASFVANDANAAITINKTGASATTATHVDVILTYSVEAQ
jgi:hypothetical protein